MQVLNSVGDIVAVLSPEQDLEVFWQDSGRDPNTHTVELTASELKAATRASILNGVADLPSLVGTTADAGAICLHVIATLTKALETATDLSDLKTALAQFEPELTAFVNGVDAETIKLPYLVKGGMEGVMPELNTVSTAVAGVFANGS